MLVFKNGKKCYLFGLASLSLPLSLSLSTRPFPSSLLLIYVEPLSTIQIYI